MNYCSKPALWYCMVWHHCERLPRKALGKWFSLEETCGSIGHWLACTVAMLWKQKSYNQQEKREQKSTWHWHPQCHIKWHCFASGKWCVSGKWCFSASGNWAPQKKQLTSCHFLKVGITVLPESEICSSSGMFIAVLVLDILDLSGIAI